MKLTKCIKFSSVVFSFWVVACVFAQEKVPVTSIKVLTDKPDAIYEKGETVKFNVKLMKDDKVISGKKLIPSCNLKASDVHYLQQ